MENSPESPSSNIVQITNADDLRREAGLTSPVNIEELRKPLKVARAGLDKLRQEVTGKTLAEQGKMIEDFVRDAEQREATIVLDQALGTATDRLGRKDFSGAMQAVTLGASAAFTSVAADLTGIKDPGALLSIGDRVSALWTRFVDWFKGMFSWEKLKEMFSKKKEGKLDNVPHTSTNAAYDIGMKLIDRLFMEKPTGISYVQEIYTDDRFRSMNVSILKEAHRTGNYEAIHAAIESDGDQKKERDTSIKSILDGVFAGDHGSHIQDAYLRAKYPGDTAEQRGGCALGQNLTLGEYIGESAQVIKKVKYLPAILSSKSHEALGLRMDDKGEWIHDPNHENEEEINEADKSGFSKPTIALALVGMDKVIYKRGEKEQNIKALDNKDPFNGFCKTPDQKEKTKKEMGELFDFGEKFIQKILDTPDLHMGLKSEFEEMFRTRGFSYKGLMLTYLTLGGRVDFENMTTIERVQFYGLITGITVSKDATTTGEMLGKYTKALRESKSAIPQSVWNFMSHMTKAATVKIGEGIWQGLKMAAGFASEDPLVAGGLLATVAPIIPAKTSLLGMAML